MSKVQGGKILLGLVLLTYATCNQEQHHVKTRTTATATATTTTILPSLWDIF